MSFKKAGLSALFFLVILEVVVAKSSKKNRTDLLSCHKSFSGTVLPEIREARLECEKAHKGVASCEDHCIVEKLTKGKDDHLDLGKVWGIVTRQFTKPGRDEEIGKLLTAISHCIQHAGDLTKPCEDHKMWACIKNDWPC